MLGVSRKIIPLVFWICMLLLFTSSGSTKTDNVYEHLEVGKYTIQTTGALEEMLRGTVYFTTESKISETGVSYASLAICFHTNIENESHKMKFLISEKNPNNRIDVGVYEVANKFNGLLNYFDGVFGFADVEKLGELPFFAADGKIKIDTIDEEILKGSIAIVLEKNSGETISVSGNFVAPIAKKNQINE